jgi:hypothetical protein
MVVLALTWSKKNLYTGALALCFAERKRAPAVCQSVTIAFDLLS